MMMRKLACFCGPILSDFLHKPRQHLKATTLSPRVLKMTSTLQISNEEHFDVLNEDGTLKGFSKPRSQVHRDGDWHRSTHIWVLDSDGCVLVQKRAMGKDTFPGRWDVSAAGHISAGGTSALSAQRELEEELGIKLNDASELQYVMSVKTSAKGCTDMHGAYIDNEFQDIYVYWPKKSIQLIEMTLQMEEVQCVEYWQWNDYCARIANDDLELVPRSEMYQREFFPWLKHRIAEKH